MPSQTAVNPRNSAEKKRAIGPGPLRTARGAGRFAAGRRLLFLFFALRLRLLEPPRPLVFDLDEDVLLLRDPGGEDVRVAMVNTVGLSHTSHTHHTLRVGPGVPLDRTRASA
jgi:hypothetical protein